MEECAAELELAGSKKPVVQGVVLWCEPAHEGFPGLSKRSLEYGAVHTIEGHRIVL